MCCCWPRNLSLRVSSIDGASIPKLVLFFFGGGGGIFWHTKVTKRMGQTIGFLSCPDDVINSCLCEQAGERHCLNFGAFFWNKFLFWKPAWSRANEMRTFLKTNEKRILNQICFFLGGGGVSPHTSYPPMNRVSTCFSSTFFYLNHTPHPDTSVSPHTPEQDDER